MLSLAVPDKRFCFDHFRPLTGIARVIDAHFSQQSRHSLGTVMEQNLYAVSKGGKTCWRSSVGGKFLFTSSVDAARDHLHSPRIRRNAATRRPTLDEYLDAHAWCFCHTRFV